MNLDDLEKSIIDWAGSRGIFAGSTPNSQMLKTMEEVGETARAVLKKDLVSKLSIRDPHRIN